MKRIPDTFEKSFASSDKTKFWSDKNEVKPRDVFKSSGKLYFFNCDCGHEIEVVLYSIIAGSWCGYCSNKKLCDVQECKSCYEKSFASNDKAKYWSNKNEVKPRDVFKSTPKKYFFNCIQCGHEIEQSLNDITSGKWCCYCSNQKLCDKKDCNLCYEKSFVSNDKAKYWSNKNEVKPRDVFKSTGKKYFFECECGHEIEQRLSDITSGYWCGYCNGIRLCSKLDCKFCYEKSFASNDKAKFWSDKNEMKPRNICKSSNNSYFFECECGHEIEQQLSRITSDSWCGYCSKPPQKLCDYSECENCFNKSFASNDKAKYWSNKNEVKPRDVFKSTSKKYFFNCKKGHFFDQSLSSITSGSWCPRCINKTEQKVDEKLITYFPTLERQFKVEWCKNKTYLPFDFVIELYKIIIEVDGPQHFIQIQNWHPPEEIQNNDKYKMECANKNGYSVIRITQEDVFYDTYDWLSELVTNIIWIIESKNKLNIFMGLKDEYSPFL